MPDGTYKLSSLWTAADSVEFDNGDTLEECKEAMEDALDQKGDGLFYDSETKLLYLLSGENRISEVEIVTGGQGELLGDVSDVIATPTETTVELKWTDPADGETVEWAGTVVLRNSEHRPVDGLDGTVIVDSTVRNQYRENGFVDQNLNKNSSYWYRFFPYDTNGHIRTGLAIAVSTLKDDTIIEEFPTVTGNYVYTGSEQTVQLLDFDIDKMVILSGSTATNAGSYTVAVAPKTGLKWPDNSTDPIYLDWTITKGIIGEIPSQSGTTTYTGSSRTPSWNNYDASRLTWSGDTSGISAGTYTATFTPTTNYQWSDGTITGRNVQWTIQKATITAVPTQNGTTNYTGSTVSPEWSNYDEAKLTISGQTSGVDAGQYVAIFTPTSNYQWFDNTTAGKESIWEIKNNAISVVPSQSGTVTYDGTTQSPTWINYDSTKLDVTGNTGSNAGSYTATFTPKTGYSWSDGTTTGKNVTWIISRATINNYPSQSGTLTYNGSSQSPTWQYYDSEKMTRSGTNSAADAGTYTATFTPTSNYQWSGGATGTRNASWTIGKANGTLTLSKQSMSFTAVNATSTSMASNYNGTLSVSTSNSSVATATVSGSTITVTCKGSGSATITVKSAATTNYYEVSKSISVTADTVQKLSVPSQSGTLTYNGSSQSPTWNNYNDLQLRITGVIASIDAGTYTVGFTPKDGYSWTDGTTSTKNVDWVINKASNNFTVSPTSVTIQANNEWTDGIVSLNNVPFYYYDDEVGKYFANVTFSISAAGYIDVANKGSSTASGGTLQFKGRQAGSVVVTVRTTDSNYVEVSKTINVTIQASANPSISPSSITIAQNQYANITLSGFTEGVEHTFTFNPAYICTISGSYPSYRLRGYNTGTGSLTVTDGTTGKSATMSITVT